MEMPFDARPSVTVRRPEPGTWTIVPDEADIKDGPVELDILETSSQYGDIVFGPATPRRSGEEWHETLTLAGHSSDSRSAATRAVLIELEEMAAEEKAKGGVVSELPQRPAAIGQTVVDLN